LTGTTGWFVGKAMISMISSRTADASTSSRIAVLVAVQPLRAADVFLVHNFVVLILPL